MEFLVNFLATLAGMSSVTVVVLVAIVVIMLVIVYFKYIKPAFIIFMENQENIKISKEDIGVIKEVTHKLQGEDSEVIQGLLQVNNEHLIGIASTLSDMRTLIHQLSIDIQSHDKGHNEKLTDMLMEMNKLSIRLEASMIQIRGVK